MITSQQQREHYEELREQYEQELVEYLERDQLVSDKCKPVPRALLSRRVDVALWVLRVTVLVLGVMVVYTFVSNLAH